LTLFSIYQKLLSQYGPQQWWPAETPFEVMVGAILTQNTAWTNVEKSIAQLKSHRQLSARSIDRLPHAELAALIRASGYFNVKATRLKNFCHWYLAQGGFDALNELDTASLRHGLLSVNGVGPETADDMMLYAFNRPIFVVDAYTRRIFSRIGLVDEAIKYEPLREKFEQEFIGKRKRASIDERVAHYNEYHALIVVHGKDVCRTKPRCEECCLRGRCAYLK
jgi:endonuclease-3 related protein